MKHHHASKSARIIKFGVLAMDKKVKSKPMQEILARLGKSGKNIEIIVFNNESMFNDPIEKWPIVDCLFTFFSTNFPIEKAINYVNLRKPFMLNSLPEQYWLMDRRMMYSKLSENGILLPNYQFMNRDGWDDKSGKKSELVEFDDYILINGVKIEKPFVEKPVDAEDHNIYVYYPRSAGGGSKRLFRKVGDKSSEFYPEISTVRREGSYIYEEFLPHGGTDVKVYVVGPDYAHAEARKSPVLDGKVHRDADGKEVRYPVLLTSKEKETAWKIAFIFGQRICGFDLLRANGKSYVCDVNGVSFVKKSTKFYDDTATLIMKMIIAGTARQKPVFRSKVQSDGIIFSASHTPVSGTSPEFVAGSPLLHDDDLFASEHSLELEEEEGIDYFDLDAVEEEADEMEELRCVIAVLRHGDRTPKQKLKMKIKSGILLAFFDTYCKSKKKELKLKSAKELTEFLATIKTIVSKIGSDTSDSDNEFDSHQKYEQVLEVLGMGGGFNGINRKVQIKPLAWGPLSLRTGDKEFRDAIRSKESDTYSEGEVVEALLIVKWGGSLTQEGRDQSTNLGKHFRETYYPGEGLGFLRLHSTFRHDLKIYSSEEGRVQMTAAAFVKGFLDLEGKHLTPILVSLVTSSPESTLMLDDSSSASKDLEKIKKDLHSLIISSSDLSATETIKKLVPTKASSLEEAASAIGPPMKKLHHLLLLISSITFQLKGKMKKKVAVVPDVDNPYKNEPLLLMYHRWDKLRRDFYNVKKDKFDLSKIPDIYDCSKYDMLHNRHLELDALVELYTESKPFACLIVPQEYGITKEEKLNIGQKISHVLLEKIKADLILSAYGDGTSVSVVSSVLNENAHLFDGSSSTPIILNESVFSLHGMYTNEKGIKTPNRRVRTRLYFTSESHIHSLFNALRYQNTNSKNMKGFMDDEKLKDISMINEHDYLTHIILKMYENKLVPLGQKGRYRVELSYSSGCYNNLAEVKDPTVFPQALDAQLMGKVDLEYSLEILTKAINEGTFNLRTARAEMPSASTSDDSNISSRQTRTSSIHYGLNNHMSTGGLRTIASSPPRASRSLSPIIRRGSKKFVSK